MGVSSLHHRTALPVWGVSSPAFPHLSPPLAGSLDSFCVKALRPLNSQKAPPFNTSLVFYFINQSYKVELTYNRKHRLEVLQFGGFWQNVHTYESHTPIKYKLSLQKVLWSPLPGNSDPPPHPRETLIWFLSPLIRFTYNHSKYSFGPGFFNSAWCFGDSSCCKLQ